MKLKPDYLTQEIDDVQFLVPVGAGGFNGLIRSNKTAAFIVNCLRKETTKDQIVDAMCEKYDAPRAEIAADVEEILETLRSIRALEE
jgi:hypothetical protein